MKQLFNEINGRALDMAFSDNTTDRNIYLWVKDNIEDDSLFFELDLSESYSCKVSFDADDRTIEIRGDEDLKFIKIRDLELINLK